MKAVRVPFASSCQQSPTMHSGSPTSSPGCFRFPIWWLVVLIQSRDSKSFRYKSLRQKFIRPRCKHFHLLGVKSEESSSNFFFHAQTILEANEIFVQFHCLSSYRIDLYRNNFCIETTSFQPMTSLCLQPVYG